MEKMSNLISNKIKLSFLKAELFNILLIQIQISYLLLDFGLMDPNKIKKFDFY